MNSEIIANYSNFVKFWKMYIVGLITIKTNFWKPRTQPQTTIVIYNKITIYKLLPNLCRPAFVFTEAHIVKSLTTLTHEGGLFFFLPPCSMCCTHSSSILFSEGKFWYQFGDCWLVHHHHHRYFESFHLTTAPTRPQ